MSGEREHWEHVAKRRAMWKHVQEGNTALERKAIRNVLIGDAMACVIFTALSLINQVCFVFSVCGGPDKAAIVYKLGEYVWLLATYLFIIEFRDDAARMGACSDGR